MPGFLARGFVRALAVIAATAGAGPAAAQLPDIPTMRAIYDAVTGGIRFEGLDGVTSVGIAKATSARLNPAGLNQLGTLSFANDYEAGWIFTDGVPGGAFDGGTLFDPGLTTGLDQFYVQATDGRVIPIVSGDQVYRPAYTLAQFDAMLYPSTTPPTAPAVESPPLVPPPPAPDEPDPVVIPLPNPGSASYANFRAIYDDATGNLRFEGLEGVRSVGLSRSGSATLNYQNANHVSPYTVAYDKEVGWIFLDGIAGGAFDGGPILPAGLTSELSQYYVSIGGQSVPITSAGGVYPSAYATPNDVEATWSPPAPATPAVPWAPPVGPVDAPPVVDVPPVFEPPAVVDVPPIFSPPTVLEPPVTVDPPPNADPPPAADPSQDPIAPPVGEPLVVGMPWTESLGMPWAESLVIDWATFGVGRVWRWPVDFSGDGLVDDAFDREPIAEPTDAPLVMTGIASFPEMTDRAEATTLSLSRAFDGGLGRAVLLGATRAAALSGGGTKAIVPEPTSLVLSGLAVALGRRVRRGPRR